MLLVAATVMISLSARCVQAQEQKKDYLTDAEGDRIRDAVTPSERMKLYVEFAGDRLKKFQYELTRSVPEGRRSEILNGLLNAYAGCIDDAADQIEVAREKQVDIRAALKNMQSKERNFWRRCRRSTRAGRSTILTRTPCKTPSKERRTL